MFPRCCAAATGVVVSARQHQWCCLCCLCFVLCSAPRTNTMCHSCQLQCLPAPCRRALCLYKCSSYTVAWPTHETLLLLLLSCAAVLVVSTTLSDGCSAHAVDWDFDAAVAKPLQGRSGLLRLKLPPRACSRERVPVLTLVGLCQPCPCMVMLMMVVGLCMCGRWGEGLRLTGKVDGRASWRSSLPAGGLREHMPMDGQGVMQPAACAVLYYRHRC